MKKAFMIALCLLLAALLGGCSAVGSLRQLLTTTTVTTVPAETTQTTQTTPAETVPVETEPVVTEPAETEPAETEPAETEPPEPVLPTWDDALWQKSLSSVTLSCGMDDSRFASDGWGTDEISQAVTELTGVTLDVVKYLHTEDLTVQIASGELPDLVCTDKLTDRFENGETSLPWDVLAEENCPEFLTLIDPVELLNNEAGDGHIYTLRSGYRSQAAYDTEQSLSTGLINAGVCFRADLLDKLEIKAIPDSFEALNDCLYTASENKKALKIDTVLNLYPAGYDILSIEYGCQQSCWWDQDAQKVKTKYRDNTWLSWYKQLNTWYRDGILAEDYLSVRPETFLERNLSGKSFAVQYTVTYAEELNGTWRAEETGGCRDDLTKPVMMLASSPLTLNGTARMADACADNSIGSGCCFISSTCSSPDRAILFMEFLKSPQGDRLTQWGLEKTHYKLTDSGLPVKTAAMMTRPEEQTKASYTGIGLWAFQGSDLVRGLREAADAENSSDSYAAQDAVSRNEELSRIKALCGANKNPALAFAVIKKSDDLYGKYTKITDEFSRVSSQMIMAESEAEVETLWYGFLAFAKENRLDDIEALMTERFKNNLWRYESAGLYTDLIDR